MKFITKKEMDKFHPKQRKNKWPALQDKIISLKGSQYLFIEKGEFQKNGFSPKFNFSSFMTSRKKVYDLDYQTFEEGYVISKK